MDFSETLRKMKEDIFEQAVRDACKTLEIKDIPEVKFWDTYCPTDTGYEFAHIHLDTRTICVSRVRMLSMDFDEVKNTAYHETSHLMNPDHSPRFHRTNNNVRMFNWKSNTGEITRSNKSKDKTRIDKLRCNYHICRKKEKLFRCRFCDGWFCSKHSSPKPPGMPKFNPKNNRERQFMEDWRSDEGHPCPDYIEHHERVLEEEKKIYSEWLKRFLSTDKESSSYSFEPEEEEKVDKMRCNYHLCREKNDRCNTVRLSRCAYCGGFFCDQHLNPARPEMPNFRRKKKHGDVEERYEGVHPCPDYASYLDGNESPKGRRGISNRKLQKIMKSAREHELEEREIERQKSVWSRMKRLFGKT